MTEREIENALLNRLATNRGVDRDQLLNDLTGADPMDSFDAVDLAMFAEEEFEIGVPDEERGQIVKAFVVLRPGYEPTADTTKALQDFVKQSVAPYKYPRRVAYVSALPRTDTGKLQRFRLRDLDTPGAS